MARTKDNEAYDALKRDITHFLIKPGARLLETELCERFGVSRTPIREALQRLEQEGLVVAMPGGRVTRPFDLREFEDMYRLRSSIECLAVEQACERATDPALEMLRASWDSWYAADAEREEDAYELAESRLEIEARVHMGIAQLSQNEMLISTLERISDRIAIVRKTDFLDAGRIEVTQLEHNAILEAIADRDAERAVELMRTHIDVTRANISRLVSGALASTFLA
ncbi:GntR family transcriptional regulator [Patulibacter defluvii]|uniref:GntR family transcriptional regulator n=1 Tax=Patulibacter defluvii TaxID=3095358 RepID=UPI002A749142|nr:GntR family transcriptional regulator [Patulibacter sp. DM4]